MILKKIRETKLINKIIRSVLKAFSSKGENVITNLQKRWPVYGVVDCQFRDVKFKMYNKCDDGLVYYFFYNKKYSEDSDLHLFKELSKSSKCVVDIGANTGLFSIVSSIANSRLKVYAFEPYPPNIERLRLNLSANNLHNVQIVPEAVGETVGYLDMTVPQTDSISLVASGNSQFPGSIHPDVSWKTITTPITTIDNFRKKTKKTIDLIKCDVETFEMLVFKGMVDTLKADRPTILFESFVNEERIFFFNDILKTYDYFLYLILEEGIVYSDSGFPERNAGLNFLIAPIKPKRNFISYGQLNFLKHEILQRPV